MTYTIVLKNGNIQKLTTITKYHVSKDFVVFFTNSGNTFTYQRDRIASIVFCP